ncbi:PREDICTED: tumor rejection antigen P815A-like [Acropora digitifera]|uniref:tumor rejection antigen P815A-like n=1 Tax=Acropora digitifera TaxID=70779 RepID=UPI00077A1AC3|nr:PREDICTED: tumor rejection antigen P815A-like [Acropora digitifera]
MTSFSKDEESIEQRTEKYYEDDDEENNSIKDGDEADDDDDDEEEGDGGEETDNGEAGSDTENDEVDPWNKLREEAINDLNSAWEEEVQENLRQGLIKDDAEIQASLRLLPVYRKKLRHLHLQYLRWYHDLKTDPVHKKVMKTLRSFMEDDEMDYTEAVEAAISKRKYLLNSLFDLEHFPTEDLASTEDDDFTYEPRKRKY